MSPLQYLLYAGLFAWAVFCATLLVVSGRRGWPVLSAFDAWRGWPILAAFSVWCVSPLPLYILRLTLEGGWTPGPFRWEDQAWSFLAGDIVLLPLLAAHAALGWRQLNVDHRAWYYRPWWLLVAFAIGIAVAANFHASEIAGYTLAGVASALLSPTKVLHDWVTYPVMFGGLLYLGLPVIIRRFRWHGAVVLLLALIWFGFAVRDANAGLNAANFHPEWSVAIFSVIR